MNSDILKILILDSDAITFNFGAFIDFNIPKLYDTNNLKFDLSKCLSTFISKKYFSNDKLSDIFNMRFVSP